MQSQKAVSAYFTSEQILPLDFAQQYTHLIECTQQCQIIKPVSVGDAVKHIQTDS